MARNCWIDIFAKLFLVKNLNFSQYGNTIKNFETLVSIVAIFIFSNFLGLILNFLVLFVNSLNYKMHNLMFNWNLEIDREKKRYSKK